MPRRFLYSPAPVIPNEVRDPFALITARHPERSEEPVYKIITTNPVQKTIFPD
ncbi:MAG TPA: hypothetical protein P5184_05250 [Bacteroidales bacterium]|nr:hypothetical protein [Bacteroidales bacterium]